MEPLLEVRRGPIVESLHRGAIALVDPSGRLLASVGDVEFVCYPRSSAKPHQAIPLVASGGADAFGMDDREIAIIAGSHGGEKIHTDTVRGILERLGSDEGALACGAHMPYDDRARRELGDRPPTAIHNNCSGKHAGMLAAALSGGHSTEDYVDPNHPVQQAILGVISRFSGIAEGEIHIGIDGCSAPIFALSVRAQALMFARLANPVGLDEAEARAARRITAAMTKHPEMIGATEGRVDTDLMRAAGGRAIAKSGAEGVECLGIFPCDEFPDGAGVAMKIEDGDAGSRARDLAFAEIVLQLLGIELSEYLKTEMTNRRGDVVGEKRTLFRLR